MHVCSLKCKAGIRISGLTMSVLMRFGCICFSYDDLKGYICFSYDDLKGYICFSYDDLKC